MGTPLHDGAPRGCPHLRAMAAAARGDESLPAASGAPVPGPPPSRWLGARGNAARFLRDPIAVMLDAHARYGDVSALVGGRTGLVFAFGPEMNRRVLSDPRLFESADVTLAGPPGSSQRRLGMGLFGMNGPRQLDHRRVLLPTMSRAAIERAAGPIARFAEDAAESLLRTRAGRTVDVYEAMRRLATRLSGTLLFGLDDPEEAFALGEQVQGWVRQSRLARVRLLRLDVPGTPYRRMLNDARRLEARLRALIRRRRDAAAAGRAPEHADVLSVLLVAHDLDPQALTDDEVIGHTNIMYAAAHDTIASTLTWTLFLLAQHQGARAGVLDELGGVLRGGPPSPARPHELPLLDAVIKESMRMLPPVVYNTRRTTAPAALGPHVLPAGSTVAISHYVTHMLPALYPQPRRFRPERWLRRSAPAVTVAPRCPMHATQADDAGEGTGGGLGACARSPYEYMPFGAGGRLCIGAAFSLSALRTVLAVLLQRVGLRMADGARVDHRVDTTLNPRGGLPMLAGAPSRDAPPARVRGTVCGMVDMG